VASTSAPNSVEGTSITASQVTTASQSVPVLSVAVPRKRWILFCSCVSRLVNSTQNNSTFIDNIAAQRLDKNIEIQKNTK